MNVTSLFVAFSLFLFLAVTPHKSLLPLIILLLLSFSLSLLLLLPLLLLFSFSQTLWHVSVDIVVFESSSSSFLSRFRFFFLRCPPCFPFLSLVHAGEVSVNIFVPLVASLIRLAVRSQDVSVGLVRDS